MMARYPDDIPAAVRRAAERFYRRLPHLHIPTGYQLDDLVDRDDETDRSSGQFHPAATPERED